MTPENYARSRIAQCADDILYALKMAEMGNPLAGEPDPVRRRDRLQAKAQLTKRQAQAADMEVRRHAADMASDAEHARVSPLALRPAPGMAGADGREKVWGDTIDFVDVAFLSRGARVARSVGRVALRNGRGQGSGVLIGGGLFLTNNHVIETAVHSRQFFVEFDYERDQFGAIREPTRFNFEPSVFIFDAIRGLDFSILALGDRVDGTGELEEFGATPLSDAPDKHMIGEFANIVQHPSGRLKEVVLRENRLVNRFEDCLHYVADTEPGSSGSPVYNSEWQMIALHHWGGPFIEGGDPTIPASMEINEGIRISSIVRHLRNNLRSYSSATQQRLILALDLAGDEARAGAAPATGERQGRAASVRVDEYGQATWTIPLEVSVRLPGFGPRTAPPTTSTSDRTTAPAREADSYADRLGYMPHFLPGFHVPLPELGPGLRAHAARLIDPVPGANPFELKYHHFSVVMNKKRRLAFFSACMIDGESAKSINRRDKTVTDLQATDPGLREAVANLEDAEADSWHIDPRIEREDFSGDELYRNQKVPGFPNPNSAGRIARMFQKGHLVRRLDPAWGDTNQALAAELDTFHWTNAAPQVGFFNQGTVDETRPGTGKGNLWRAAANYVLRNAVAENQRVVSFTGPIFNDNDRPFRHTRVPGRFFKVTVWVEDGVLRALALVVDQAQVIAAWPEALGRDDWPETLDAAEAFQDPDELDRVTDFLSTVEEVEQATELDFGTAVRNADIRRDLAMQPVSSDRDLPLKDRDRSGRATVALYGALAQPDGPPDDLTHIRGIGPQLLRLLNHHGIFHFRQIAAWGPDEVRNAGALLRFPGRIERDDWVAQAKRLSDGEGTATT